MMNEARSDFGMEEANGKLFSVGGGRASAGVSMEWMDLTDGLRWTRQDLTFRIDNHCMTKFNETHLIVTGGRLKVEGGCTRCRSEVCEMSFR